MSTERLSFGFNSLIPETYKTKAEAFAKCLQHKLLSLGRYETPSDSYGNESRKRLSDDHQQEESGNFNSHFMPISDYGQTSESARINEASQRVEKTEDSDEEFCSHSESENSDFSEQRKQRENLNGDFKQKLTSMSSEDSTVESWSSCQEDLEKFDSESEEVNFFASQIKGSPKLRSLNLRVKRKEIRDKPWKKSPRKNYSSSTENVDSECRGNKHTCNYQIEDPESHPQYILLDGLEDDAVPHRILRESSSTSSLEKHFSRSCNEESRDFSKHWRSKKDHKMKDEVIPDPQLLTPPPSPDLHRNINGEFETEEKNNSLVEEKNNKKPENITNGLKFAEVKTDLTEVQFDEVESMKDFCTDDVSRSVKKIGGVIVECSSNNSTTELDVSPESTAENIVVSCVEVLQHNPESGVEEKAEVIIVEPKKSESEEKSDDEILNNHGKLRRSSSLKTWKTPPGTPGGKKIVRFADALGLDLADVRTFLDEIPRVPSSAYADLDFSLPSSSEPLLPPVPCLTLIPQFQQPGNKMDFLHKIQLQKVCLETALVSDMGILMVSGYVRVQNMSFHKSVHVRYTINNWHTFSDLQATYVPNSCDGFSDKFSFNLFGHTLKTGDKLEFALRLECSGTQYWDNNGGINYVFNCLPQNSLSTYSTSLCNEQSHPWFDFF